MASFGPNGSAIAGPPTGFPEPPPGPDPAAVTRLKELLWVLVSFSFVFLSLRLYCKARGKGLFWDDLVLFLSWVRGNTLSGTACLRAEH